MSFFSYEATDESGKTITGVMEADSKSMAIEKLQQDRFFPVSVKPQKTDSSGFSFNLNFFSKGMSQKELINFTRQMATLMRSGLELDRSLSILVELTENEKSRDAVKDIQKSVHGGESLTSALSKQRESFSPLYLSMVKAGETGGFMERAFDRLAWYLENRMKTTESVRSAMIYPAVIFFTGISALTILTTYVIPRFNTIFDQMGGELPFSAQLLIGISDFIISYWLVIITLLFLAVASFSSYIASSSGKRNLDILLLKLPLVGDLIRKTSVAEFSRTLGTLLESGVPIVDSLKIVKETITLVPLAEAVEETSNAVRGGKRLSSTLKGSNIFPALATHMMMVGEEGGNLDDMMLRTAHIYDDEVEVAVKRILTLFEPAMILIMGIIVAFVVVTMLSAIISVNDIPF